MMFLLKIKNRKHKKSAIVRILNILLFIIVAGIMYSIGVASYENMQVYIDTKAFKERATTEIAVDYEYNEGVIQKRIYHVVPRETSWELEDTRSVFYNENKKYLGQIGDIYLTQQSPLPEIPVIHQFVGFYFGGHATFKAESNTFYEATGMTGSFKDIIAAIKLPNDVVSNLGLEASQTASNFWLNPNYRNEESDGYNAYGTYYRTKFYGLRVKNIDQNNLTGLIDFGKSIKDKAAYNYLFFLDMTNKYYCTDMVSRAYQSIMLDEDKQGLYAKTLNDDGFITSVNDIILSNDTYITTYVEIIDDVVHIYYLEDVE